MATFNGFLVPGAGSNTTVTSDTNLRQLFYNNIPFTTTVTAVSATTAVDGTLTSNPTNPAANNFSGVLFPAYVSIFYNRIIIDPIPIDVGNVVTDITVQLSIYNAYFTSSTLENIVETNLEGITLVGPATPTGYGALQEIVYDVEVAVGEGPPTIDGDYFFDFTDADKDSTLQVTGSRVLVLPYLFQAGLVETLSWNTKVMTSNNGYEQRMKLRNAPRQEYTFDIAIQRGQIAQLDSLLYGWRGNFFGLPISSECRGSTVPTATNSPNIDVNTEFGDFRVGGLAMLYNSPTDIELVTILSMTTNQIVTSTNITKVYATGTLVIPVQTARLLANPIRSTTGDTQRLTARFQVANNILLTTTPSPDQYKGLDVYLEEPLTIDAFATDTYNTRVDLVDFSTGALEVFTPWLKTKTQRVFGLQFNSLEEVWNYRLWLHRRGGKLRPFWMPTFEANFTLVTTGSLNVQLEVLDEEQLGLTTERNDIAILTTSGWLFREISSIEQFGNNLLVTITLSLGIDASTVDIISFMGKKRLTSDNLEISWDGNNTSKASVPITEINN